MSFCLRAKDSADSYGYLESADQSWSLKGNQQQRFSSNDPGVTIQQRRKFSRDANSAATQIQQRRLHLLHEASESRRLAPTSFTRKPALQTVGGDRSTIRSMTGIKIPPSIYTRRSDEFWHGRKLLVALAVGPQSLRLRNHNFGLAQRIMVKRLATSPHDPLDITDSACKNQLVVVSVQYGPFNTYIPIRSTTIGKSRVARDPIAMHTSWRSNSDIASVTSIGYPRMKASDESSTTKHRLLHASGPHPIPPPNDPKTNQYNQDLGLIHSKNGNHLESSNEGSSIDHQVTIHLHAQNITIFPTNETWYFTSQMLVSSSGGLILILTAQSTRNKFRMHSDY
ncbi:carboxyl-terminal-processing peptidase 1, chloroplastic [Dorcoceras hygrometricum]|uniref:Carboxyl-terminal-processing peptidase 1, chloroplastic n=1 Tax=Dorcoceras hygrometricum TaxID=472368 RepID=A0A2Z7CH65_9LAMI|nr:carboxyl-terminal-processing peptidase 1, chloroplastic [Dorcoceras hygrometricum]